MGMAPSAAAATIPGVWVLSLPSAISMPPHPVIVMLFQKEVWSCLSGHQGMPAWGTGVAWQQEVLDPRNERTLKVSRAKLQCIASLWGQDYQPPKEKDKGSECFSPCLCVSSPWYLARPQYLIPEQAQRETQELGWPCTRPP